MQSIHHYTVLGHPPVSLDSEYSSVAPGSWREYQKIQSMLGVGWKVIDWGFDSVKMPPHPMTALEVAGIVTVLLEKED